MRIPLCSIVCLLLIGLAFVFAVPAPAAIEPTDTATATLDNLENPQTVVCHTTGTTAGTANSPLTGTFLDYFTNYGLYMARTHCVINASGQPDWPWIIALVVLTTTIIAGYLRIFFFWRQAYLDEAPKDRNEKLMNLAYIFLWCAVCGYAMSLLSFVWPAYRLLAIFLAVLNFFTWRFATTLGDFRISLSAKRLARQLRESLETKTSELQLLVDERTRELTEKNDRLKSSELRFNQMVANVPGMVYQVVRMPDGSYVYEYVSDGVREIFGVTPEEALADSENVYSRVHPEEVEQYNAACEATIPGLDPWRWEGRVVSKNGEVRWVRDEARGLRLPDGRIRWDGIILDVTASHMASEALEEARSETRKLALVAAHTRNAVVITDPDGNIEWVNRGYTAITGYELSEVKGKKPSTAECRNEIDTKTAERIRLALERGEAAEGEILHRHKQGYPYWLKVEVQPVRDEQHKLTNFILIKTDISDAKQAERELAAARDAANAASQAKSEFLAKVSHEIRTPLGGIIGFSDMLLREPDTHVGERTVWAATIKRSAHHLLSLINDVLDVSKIEAGKMEFESIACSPHELMSEVASVMRVPATEKGLMLAVQYRTELPEKIVSDPTRVKQVLLNLINNAIKFTESGQIRVIVDCNRDPVTQLGKVLVHVSDTGIGMTDEQASRLFQPFVQGDNSMTRRFGGTGLGLTISRYICQQLGGTLTATSQPGVGSVFTASFNAGPLTGVRMIDASATEAIRPASGVQPSDTATVPAIRPERLKGARILLADDGETNRQLLSLILKRAGAEMVLAVNGAEAITMHQNTGPFDMVLMDMQMPVMDGYTAVTKLREMGVKTPILALTAHAMNGDRERCLAAGCDDYLTKPIETEKLLETLDAVYRSGRHRSALSDNTNSSTSVAAQPSQNGSHNTAASDATGPILSRLPDDEEFLSIARSFVTSVDERVSVMRTAVLQKDDKTLVSEAHKLKGAGGMAGYPDIAEVALRVEQAALRRQLEAIGGELESLEQLVRRCKQGFGL